MVTLKDLIHSLDESTYLDFLDQTENSKGTKYAILLRNIRNNSESEDIIVEDLDVNASAYYALKSRLLDKLRQFITIKSKKTEETFKGTSDEILSVTIDNDPTTAKIVLENLEKKYILKDQHLELLAVYAALKRIYLNTEKHYHYSQKYNHHLSVFLALNKSEELLGNFSTLLNKYLLSGDKKNLELLKVIIEELKHISTINSTVTLRFYYIVATSLYSMRVEKSLENSFEDVNIEESLEKFGFTHFENNAFERRNQFILFSLKFEYYYLTRQYKKAAALGINMPEHIKNILVFQFFIPAQSNLLQVYHLFLLQKINSEQQQDFENAMEWLCESSEATDSAIYYHLCKALMHYNAKDYTKCVKTVTNLINTHSLKGYCLSEIELKYLLCLALLKMNKIELIDNYLKSISRKKKQLNNPNMHFELMEKKIKSLLKSNDFNKLAKLREDLKQSLAGSQSLFLHLIKFE